MKRFADCFRKLDNLKQPQKNNDYDDLARIANIGGGISLKNSFAELVNEYLELRGKNILVIQVDDADLNTARAYEIVEDIRKYCGIPRVLVLMAVHLGTLLRCVEQNNVRTYEMLLQTGINTDHMERSKCREMAERYVDKLIPGIHQIHLPYIEDIIREQDTEEPGLKYLDDEGCDLLNYEGDVEDSERKEAYLKYQARIFRFIYEKTGIILMPHREYMHNFLPQRMRELVHLLGFLNSLEDINVNGDGKLQNLLTYAYRMEGSEKEKKIEKCIELRAHNLEQFERYFVYHWCAVNFTQDEFNMIEKIMRTSLSVRNRHVVEYLNSYCKDKKIKINESCFERVQKDLRHVSYGKAIEMLEQMKRSSTPNYKLIYAIQMQYTIYLNRMLCEALKDKKRFQDIIRLFRDEIFSEKEYIDTENCTGRFIISTKLLSAMMGEIGREEQDLLWFCVPCDKEGKILYDVPLTITREECLFINPSLSWIVVDIWHYLLAELNNINIAAKRIGLGKVEVARVVSIMQVLCNYDVQYRIKKDAIPKWQETICKENNVRQHIAEQWPLLLTYSDDVIYQWDGQETETKQMLPLESQLADASDREDAKETTRGAVELYKELADQNVSSNELQSNMIKAQIRESIKTIKKERANKRIKPADDKRVDLRFANPAYCIREVFRTIEVFYNDMDIRNNKRLKNIDDLTNERCRCISILWSVRKLPVFHKDMMNLTKKIDEILDMRLIQESYDQTTGDWKENIYRKIRRNWNEIRDIVRSYAVGRETEKNEILKIVQEMRNDELVEKLMSPCANIFEAFVPKEATSTEENSGSDISEEEENGVPDDTNQKNNAKE